ncbi:MAG: ribosome recycling factor [Deltaproteobacteria bacterium]|nr:ribosome recycling factor [Deltaproteobacteria bacterium]
MEKIINTTKEHMEKSLSAFKQELITIRTGKANAAMLDGVKVEAYGALTPLNQVGTIKTPDPKLITVEPWDKGLIGAIEKAIQKADLGLSPTNDGKMIRLAIPSLSEDRRKNFVKVAKKYAEDCKVAVRMARRDGNEALTKLEKGKEITEDDSKKSQERIQKLTDSFNSQVDTLVAHKEKELMTV